MSIKLEKIYVACNHQWRQFRDLSDVPPRVLQKDFDWIDPTAPPDRWIHYRNRWYVLDNFMWLDQNSPLAQHFDGYAPDSFFSGVCIKLHPYESDLYQIGTYIT